MMLLMDGCTDLQAARLEEGEHALGRVEGVSPVVIGHVLPVVLLHTQDPLAQTLQQSRGIHSDSPCGCVTFTFYT